jgi:hypothetical protein
VLAPVEKRVQAHRFRFEQQECLRGEGTKDRSAFLLVLKSVEAEKGEDNKEKRTGKGITVLCHNTVRSPLHLCAFLSFTSRFVQGQRRDRKR